MSFVSTVIGTAERVPLPESRVVSDKMFEPVA